MKCYPTFSEADSDLSELAWRTDRYGYARRTVQRKPLSPYSVMAHRDVMSRVMGRELLSAELVDHINHIKLDNRRENLRLVNAKGNSQNRGGNPFRGTTLHPCGKWQAQVGCDGMTYYLGLFDCQAEAAAAARAKRAELGFLES